MDKNSNKTILVSIVVPTYKEAENLRPLISRISSAIQPLSKPYEIIVVDDDSGDGTDELLQQMCSEGYPVKLISRSGRRGLSSAVIEGFTQAAGQFLVCMDADLSHPPETIPLMIESLADTNVVFAVASRYIAGGSFDGKWGLWNRTVSRTATILAAPFTHIHDPMSGFFGLSNASFLQAKYLNPIGAKILLELIVKCGTNSEIREIPIHFSRRNLGKSKLGARAKIDYLRHVLRLAKYKYKGVIPYFLRLLNLR